MGWPVGVLCPLYMDWLRVTVEFFNWLARNCKRSNNSMLYRQAELVKTHWQLTGQPNTKLILSGSAEPIRHPLLTDQLAWYQTQSIWIGQTSKKPIVSRLAGLISNLFYAGWLVTNCNIKLRLLHDTFYRHTIYHQNPFCM